MHENIGSSRWSLAVTMIMLAYIFCDSAAWAGPRVFAGNTTSIIPDKTCPEKVRTGEIVLLLDGDPVSDTSGWFYGKETSPAEFRMISPMRYEVTYPVTRYRKLPPSHMELQPFEDGFRAVVRDHIPEDKELRESACFYERMEVVLKPVNEPAGDIRAMVGELFSAELILQEGTDLLFSQKDYRSAEEKGRKALDILERIHGKSNRETLNASALIMFSLMWRDRFDEALEVIAPYCALLPDDKELKEIGEILRNLKNLQDELFRYDPDSRSTVVLEPIG
jgi:hypothetical protein